MKILNLIKSMDKKQLLKLILATVIILVSLIIVVTSNKGEDKMTADNAVTPQEEVKPLEFTQDQLNEYYKTYDDPYVKHVRVALNSYLNGATFGIDSFENVVKQKTNAEGKVSGLDAYSKDYYKSKFIVLMASPSVAGGKEVNIIFQDKPDKIFWTWVYANQPNVYVLRGFSENSAITGEKLENLLIQYKNILEDKEHSL